MEPRHTISVWVENLPGVLSRVTGLFSGRGFNIESLCVAETMDPEVSRITIVSTGDEAITEQILKQLHKLINVIKVVDFSGLEHVEREMALVTVRAEGDSRAEVFRLADIFRCRVVDRSLPSCRYFPVPGGGRQPHHLYPGNYRQLRQDAGGAGQPQGPRHPGHRPHRRPGHSPDQEGLAVIFQRSAISSQLKTEAKCRVGTAHHLQFKFRTPEFSIQAGRLCYLDLLP